MTSSISPLARRQAALCDLAHDVRRFLLPHWARWQSEQGAKPPVPLSSNTCGRSSLLLRDALRREGFGAEWRNGIPRPCGHGQAWTSHGFFIAGPPQDEKRPLGGQRTSRSGEAWGSSFTGPRWEGHAWVECEGLILDITADQFGARPVEVTPATDPRYAPNDIDTARPEAIRRRQETVRALFPAWLAHRARHVAWAAAWTGPRTDRQAHG